MIHRGKRVVMAVGIVASLFAVAALVSIEASSCSYHLLLPKSNKITNLN